MAELMDRIRNIYDDHQDREHQQARQQGYRSALYEARDALLSAALATHQQWRKELQASGPGGTQETIHAKYAARLQGLNDAFAVLRQAEPGITTQLDVEQFQRSVTERAQSDRQERSLAANRTDRGYDSCVVLDSKLEFIPEFYSPERGDKILSPKDATLVCSGISQTK